MEQLLISIIVYSLAFGLRSKFLMAMAMGLTFWFYVVVKTNREYDSIE